MKHHIMIALGVLMAIIFVVQAIAAFQAPGIGVREVYVLGGFILAGWLIKSGIAEWRHARNSQ